MLGIERHVRDPHLVGFHRKAHVVRGQFVHHQEALALARHDREDRPLPRLHVGVEVGRELKEIRGGEHQRIDGEFVHQPDHLVVAVPPDGLRQLGHVSFP
ncbi:hypothetical protein D9M68_928850 [compost metagenome]